MRHFQYFLYENFDPDTLSKEQQNPRTVLRSPTDCVLSKMAEMPAFSYWYQDACADFSRALIDSLIDVGVIRVSNGFILFDTPIILQQDQAVLTKLLADRASRLADGIEQHKSELYSLAQAIKNGFDVRTNLYHILCGAVFDGCLFDALHREEILTTSRLHTSGLDYLIVIYEQCAELCNFSNQLLCSYNRLTDGVRSLQSFGDCAGNRFDFYRLFRLWEQNALQGKFLALSHILNGEDCASLKGSLLLEVQKFVDTGICSHTCLSLLERFGYAKDGKLCVPVFRRNDQSVAQKISDMILTYFLDDMKEALLSSETGLALTCAAHGVSPMEIANELYHILFGLVNEILVSRRFVCTPVQYPGEGRYLKSIEVL